ncbi:hypothetical protein PR002_g31408 [Phytophthora rubi]|uniref:Uncharacterized protein n=1 Tax=Phytophthora rubi TaxID=129364 RepID=A0A6A3GDB9_9STRA|nr:hypothetical protein PR002_g31408 [Phytophthora rubi]
MLEYVSNDIDSIPEPQRSENASNDVGPILPRQQVGADGAPETRVTIGNTTFREGRGLMVAVMALIDVSTYSNMDPMNLQVLLGGQLQVLLFLSLGLASEIPRFGCALISKEVEHFEAARSCAVHRGGRTGPTRHPREAHVDTG